MSSAQSTVMFHVEINLGCTYNNFFPSRPSLATAFAELFLNIFFQETLGTHLEMCKMEHLCVYECVQVGKPTRGLPRTKEVSFACVENLCVSYPRLFVCVIKWLIEELGLWATQHALGKV